LRDLSCTICGLSAPRVLYRETLRVEESATAHRRLEAPESVHYRINRCSGCGLVYSSPILDEAGVAALYTQSPHTNVDAGEEGNVRRTLQGYYNLVRPHLRARDRFLDIGCDVGILLDIGRQDGFREVHGVEPNPVAAVKAARISGSHISREFYESTPYPAEHFDSIAFIHVADHLVDVNRFLGRVLRDLRPGGIALAVVHNVGSLLARVLGERFPPFNAYHHYFFSKRTLALLFSHAGFEVIRVLSTANCYSLGFLVDRAPFLPVALRRAIRGGMDLTRLGRLPITMRLGNIGIVARKPGSPASAS